MAELYRRVEDDPKYGRSVSVRHEAVGYTEDDVRRLAIYAANRPYDSNGPHPLAPFHHLLDGGDRAKA